MILAHSAAQHEHEVRRATPGCGPLRAWAASCLGRAGLGGPNGHLWLMRRGVAAGEINGVAAQIAWCCRRAAGAAESPFIRPIALGGHKPA
jgi:hypothetical protein